MFNQLKTVRTVLLAVVNPEPVIIDWGLLYSLCSCCSCCALIDLSYLIGSGDSKVANCLPNLDADI